MSLVLHIDSDRWTTQVQRSFAAAGDVTTVPVVKGNGYGFTNATLATVAADLGADTLAVGTYDEISQVTGSFAGDIVVLSPWRSGMRLETDDSRIIHTVSRLSDLQTLTQRGADVRVVVEVMTSMRRHGLALTELNQAAALLGNVTFEGFTVHLPRAGNTESEVRELAGHAADAAKKARIANPALWVSHVTTEHAEQIAKETGNPIRLRRGTALWLGATNALRPTSTVLDVHTVNRGETFGYWQRRAKRSGTLAVVSGGTAHGVALSAPSPASTLRQRSIALATGGLDASGKSLSPFRIQGKSCWFAEPPHMQASMIWVPRGVAIPNIGDEIDVTVRYTTTHFDHFDWH